MFTHIARGYDWFDHLASLGQDLLWRPRALWDLDRYLGGSSPHRILDLGCGPGSLTFLVADHYPDATVVGADFTAAMVAAARASASHRSGGPRSRFLRASAGALPFRAGSFDLAMSAFVARNLPDLGRAFREVALVLRPGGILLTLEITEPASPWVRRGFHSYFDRVVPALGRIVGSGGPYTYLPESLRHLPDRSGMLGLLSASGFEDPVARPQSMGIVTSYLARARGSGQSR